MSSDSKLLLPHHQQQPLCTTRLPYRQGRKLTAVKVYSINNESNHLLIFGVPSLNLRQEAKALFHKFGKLLQFNISKEHIAEDFTETYHAAYDKIQSARMAKKFLDTKNFYGGSLHVCYAPEFESISETREKLLQRQRDVLYRLRNLQKEKDKLSIVNKETNTVSEVPTCVTNVKLNMGEENTILINNEVKRKRKNDTVVIVEKKFKPCFIANENASSNILKAISEIPSVNNEIEIIDFTSTETETLTNINESLNYKNFGNEIVRKVEQKPLNRIKFNLSNKKT